MTSLYFPRETTGLDEAEGLVAILCAETGRLRT